MPSSYNYENSFQTTKSYKFLGCTINMNIVEHKLTIKLLSGSVEELALDFILFPLLYVYSTTYGCIYYIGIKQLFMDLALMLARV